MYPKMTLIFLVLYLLQAVAFSSTLDDNELETLLNELDSTELEAKPPLLQETEVSNDDFGNSEATATELEDTESDGTPLEAIIDKVDHMAEARKLSETGIQSRVEDMIDDDYHRELTRTLEDPRYEKVGCYLDKGGDNRPLPILVHNLRPQINQNWTNLDKIIHVCAILAEYKGYTYFGIQYWGECWSGPKADQTYDKDGPSKDCAVGVGKAGSYFVYRFKPKTTTSPPPPPTTMPGECMSYKELSEADRSVNQGPLTGKNYKCDSELTPGWYRFTGDAGTQMATSCVSKLHCSTHATGWMEGSLPSLAEGSVERKVCFNWLDKCCFWKQNIMVRNCGGYFVYKLEKPVKCKLRYCGSGRAPPITSIPSTPKVTTVALATTKRTTVTTMKTTTASSPPPITLPGECNAYKELSEADRSVNQGPYQDLYTSKYKCDSDLTPGWYRFTGDAGTQMATSCVPAKHCSAHAPGWMEGTLPNVADGSVERKVCFHWLNKCCYWKQNIMVRNCGGYFVYKLEKPVVCRLRFCGSSGGAVSTTSPTAEPTTIPPTTAKPTTIESTTMEPSTVAPTTMEQTTVARTTIEPTSKPTKQNFILCEHRSGILRCPKGKRVKVVYANYGRTTRHRCPHKSMRTTRCVSGLAASLIRCACNGRNFCPLFAKNQVYGDPCRGTYKYIEVKYFCI